MYSSAASSQIRAGNYSSAASADEPAPEAPATTAGSGRYTGITLKHIDLASEKASEAPAVAKRGGITIKRIEVKNQAAAIKAEPAKKAHAISICRFP